MKYTIKGYTGPNPDFTDTIELPDSLKLTGSGRDELIDGHNLYHALKPLLLNTAIPTDYLEVFDADFADVRADLADHDAQIVLLAEGLGCENCHEEGDNEYTDGCDLDAPHGGFMLLLEPVVR